MISKSETGWSAFGRQAGHLRVPQPLITDSCLTSQVGRRVGASLVLRTPGISRLNFSLIGSGC